MSFNSLFWFFCPQLLLLWSGLSFIGTVSRCRLVNSAVFLVAKVPDNRVRSCWTAKQIEYGSLHLETQLRMNHNTFSHVADVKRLEVRSLVQEHVDKRSLYHQPRHQWITSFTTWATAAPLMLLCVSWTFTGYRQLFANRFTTTALHDDGWYDSVVPRSANTWPHTPVQPSMPRSLFWKGGFKYVSCVLWYSLHQVWKAT